MNRAATDARAPARMRGFIAIIAVVVLAAILIAVGWTLFTLSWSYSEGERAGILQKFSKRGWVCKTWEGELALYVVGGVSPQIWNFSTRDPALAQQLSRAVGERVQLHYTEHRGVPTNCFAETPYFAESVRLIRELPR